MVQRVTPVERFSKLSRFFILQRMIAWLPRFLCSMWGSVVGKPAPVVSKAIFFLNCSMNLMWAAAEEKVLDGLWALAILTDIPSEDWLIFTAPEYLSLFYWF